MSEPADGDARNVSHSPSPENVRLAGVEVPGRGSVATSVGVMVASAPSRGRKSFCVGTVTRCRLVVLGAADDMLTQLRRGSGDEGVLSAEPHPTATNAQTKLLQSINREDRCVVATTG